MTQVLDSTDPLSTPLAFDRWLKRRRHALGFTQVELAQKVACAAVTIKKIEAGDLQPSQQLAELLASALGVPESETPAFVRFARTALSAAPAPFHLPPDALQLPPPAMPLVRSNLPAPLTSFIGRERDVIAGVKLLLRPDLRLLTLVGPPGAGKTRLSIQIAAAVAPDFVGGVYFVELAATTTAEAVVLTLAQTLNVNEIPGQTLFETVLAHLRGQTLLLVFDNFEQVLTASWLVTNLLGFCAGVKALVTSREALHIYGENEYPLAPLELPDIRRLPPVESLALYPAIELFVGRAQAAAPTFDLTPANATAVANICAYLDGLPLALEMAAARVKWLAPEALLAQLRLRLSVLTGGPRDLSPRQQTLRGAIDWSYDLLSAREQRAFRWWAVFAGGDVCRAATVLGEPLAASEPPHLTLEMESLINKSLIQYLPPAGDVPSRWRMLETIREYAQEKLQEAGEWGVARQAHVDYYLSLAQTARPALAGAEQRRWLRILDLEHDNLRAALQYCVETHPALGLQLAVALRPFWQARGFLSEGLHWLEDMLRQNPHLPTTATLRAQAQWEASELADALGQIAKAEGLATESVHGFRALGDMRGLADALCNLANVRFSQNDYGSMVALLEEALGLYRQIDQPLGVAHALSKLGMAAKDLGNYPRAVECLEQSYQLQQSLGNTRGMSYDLIQLSFTMFWTGNYARSQQLAEQSLLLGREIANQHIMALAWDGLGAAAHRQRDHLRGAQALRESLNLYREMGNRSGEAMVLMDMGLAAQGQGDYERAARLHREALVMADSVGDRRRIAFCLEGLAQALITLTPSRAAELCGAAEALRAAIQAPLPPSERDAYMRTTTDLRLHLGDEGFETQRARGRIRPWSDLLTADPA